MMKIKNRLFSALLVLLMVITTMFTAGFPAVAYAQEVNTSFVKTNVLDDLRSSSEFNILEYPFDDTGLIKRPSIVNFVEYSYSYKESKQGNYGLFVYFYNPQGLTIDTDNKNNKIQLATKYDADGNATDYEKFDLQFCSMSTEPDYYGLFYKFKIIDHESADGKTILQRVNSNERRYDVSGIELVTEGNETATDYSVGGTYKFTGYVKGCGPDENAESTLVCDVTELETVSLDVRDTSYRMDSVSHLGEGHQNDLHSVYFSVPNSLLERYGALQKIKAEWYEYRTGPVIVTEDKGMYDYLKNYTGTMFTPSGWNNLQYKMFSDYTATGGITSQNAFALWWLALNESELSNDDYDGMGFPIEFFPYLFYTGGESAADYTLTGEELKNYIYDYSNSAVLGYLPTKSGQISADLFAPTDEPITALNAWDIEFGRKYGYNCFEFDAGDTFDMLTYDDTHSGWDKFWDFFLFPPKTDGSVHNIEPIYKVKENDVLGSNAVIAGNLLMNVNDVDDFKAYYSNAIQNGETVFVFRFAQTDYLSAPIAYTKDGKTYTDKAYVASENVFMDFDIIHLTFNRDGVYKVIPAVSNPVDIVGDISAPLDMDEPDMWLIILGVLMVIILLVIFAPLLPYLLQGIWWLICLPFKGLAALVRLIKDSIDGWQRERKLKKQEKQKQKQNKEV